MMLRSAVRRRLGALCAALVLLSQGLAVAHACNAPVGAAGQPVVAQATCHEFEADASPLDNAALCKTHCESAQQLPAQAAPADMPPASSGWFLVMTPQPQAALALPLLPRWPAAQAGAPPGWPPLHLTLQVLRN